MARPFVTIGITTYRRHDLLREALESILAQGFGDFEVIVGNDYQGEVLTAEMLGISDPRIRIVNHPVNLREVGNMNALLAEASGRYFTWLFDDDLYEPGFLQAAHDALESHGFPPACFPSYRTIQGSEPYLPAAPAPGRARLLTGVEYLEEYFSGGVKLISTCALFDTALLRTVVGGVEELCSSAVGLYCEYLFLVRCALLTRVVYLDAPFVVFRAHADSWGASNVELEKYLAAGRELVRRSAAVLRRPELSAAGHSPLLGLCRIHLSSFAFKCAEYEVARGRRGAAAAWGALTRLGRETAATRQAYLAEGGAAGPATSLGFLGIAAKCCYLVAYTFASRRPRRGEG